MGDEKFYLEATKEAEGENRDPALWAKAMALCGGDAGKAKYEYVRCRVESLLEKNKYTGEGEQHLRIEANGKQEISAGEDANNLITDKISPSNRNLMRKHGISFDGGMYRYKGHKYAKLDYAIKHAEPTDALSKPNIYGNQNKKVVSTTAKSFKIYKHPVQGYEVIKDGFSWPGFFFTWIWAFTKKLWVHGIILIIVVFVGQSIMYELALSGGGAGNFIGLLISIIPMIVAGKKGNEWREKSMSARGFQMEATVMAQSFEGALAEAMKPENERNIVGIKDTTLEKEKKKDDRGATRFVLEEVVARIIVYPILLVLIVVAVAYIIK